MSFLTDEIARLQKTLTADLTQHALQVLKHECKVSPNSIAGKNSPKAGEYFPAFILPNAYGQLINSRDLLSQGPLVISFFKGQWHPYCNLELRAFQHFLPEIKSRNAQLTAITPMLPSHCMEIQESAKLDYEVLSDVGNRLARELDLTYRLADEVIDVYLEAGYDLSAINGDDSWQLPVPATYLIESSGKIALAHIDTDDSKRLDPTAIIAVLSAIQDTSDKTQQRY